MARIKVNREEGINSYKLSKMVSELKDIEGVEKAVLRVLADHYPNIFPGMETIGELAGWCENTTRKALQKLERDGWVKDISGPSAKGKLKAGGKGKSTQYAIVIEKIQPAEEPDSPSQTLRHMDGIAHQTVHVVEGTNPPSGEPNPPPHGEEHRNNQQGNRENKREVRENTETPNSKPSLIPNLNSAPAVSPANAPTTVPRQKLEGISAAAPAANVSAAPVASTVASTVPAPFTQHPSGGNGQPRQPQKSAQQLKAEADADWKKSVELTDYVLEVAADSGARFTSRDVDAIRKVIFEKKPTREELAKLVRREVREMDQYALNRAGEYFATQLGAWLVAYRKKQKEYAALGIAI